MHTGQDVQVKDHLVRGGETGVIKKIYFDEKPFNICVLFPDGTELAYERDELEVVIGNPA